MKCLVVTDFVSRSAGGLFDAERCLHGHLAAVGVETVVLGLEDPYSREDAAKWALVRPRVFPLRAPAALGWSPAHQEAVQRQSGDLLYRAGLWTLPSRAAHRWSRTHGKPEIIAPHGMLDPWALRQSAWKKRLVRWAYEDAHLRDAACLRALCQSEADSIRAFGLRNPIAIIPNGVEMPEQIAKELSVVGGPLSVNADESQGAARKHIRQQTTDNGQRILLFLGRIHPKKGLVNALRAWAELSHSKFNIQNSTFTNWQFVVSGWDQGGHEAELKRLCGELGLAWAEVPAAEFLGDGGELSVVGCRLSDELDVGAEHFPSSQQITCSRVVRRATTRSTDNGQRTTDNRAPVVFLGPAFGEAKDQLLRQAHAFILPSFSEGLPMAVLEAWAYGLPVLMTDHCNLPEGFAARAAIRVRQETGDRGQRTGVRSQESGVRGEGASIAEGMRELVEMSDADRLAMGRRGRALVERQFTWPSVAAQMKEVYDWVVGGGRPPDCVRQF